MTFGGQLVKRKCLDPTLVSHYKKLES